MRRRRLSLQQNATHCADASSGVRTLLLQWLPGSRLRYHCRSKALSLLASRGVCSETELQRVADRFKEETGCAVPCDTALPAGRSRDEDRARRGDRDQPRSQLRHPQAHDDRRGRRARRRDPQRPRARGRFLPARPPRQRPRGPTGRRHRGHLAVPVPLALLAPWPRDDDGDRGRRHCPVGHQGQGRRAAGLPAARWPEPTRRARLRPRRRHERRGALRRDPQPPRPRVPRDPRPDRRARSGQGLRRRHRPASRRAVRLRAGRQDGGSGRGALGLGRVPAAHSRGLRGGALRVRPRAAAAARRAPSPLPERGGAPRPLARALRPVLARGRHAGGQPGVPASGPLADHHTAGDRRGASTPCTSTGP